MLVGCAIVSLLGSAEALAHDHQMIDKVKPKQSIMVHRPWSRALPPVARNGAAYLMLHNNSAKPDRLLSASSPIAQSVMFHQNVSQGNSVSMAHVNDMVIKPRSMIEFKPGGYHLMLMGLKRPLVAGEYFELTLQLENAGEVVTRVLVKNSQGKKMPMSHDMNKH